MPRLCAWDRASTRFGLEARPGSKLRAQPDSGLGARLGSEPGSAHLGSENITSETKPERRKCKTKTFRRESVKVKADEKRERKCHEKNGTTRGYALTCFRTKQRQKAAPRGKIYVVGTVPTLPVIAW